MTGTPFFKKLSFFSFERKQNLRESNKMKVWFETTKSGQKGETRGPVLTRETDVREETKEPTRRFFTDL